MSVYQEHKKLLWLIFIGLLVFSASVLGVVEYVKYTHERERVTYITFSHASKLKYVVNTFMLKTDILKILLKTDKGALIQHFDGIAAKLTDDPAIRSLQLAPGGVVTYIYPIKGNEAAYGDLFADPQRATEAKYARDSGKTTISGPYNLMQGGLGLVIRNPVYFKTADGKPYFWGFTIIILDLPAALRHGGLDLLEQEGYDYKLSRINPDTRRIQVFHQTTDAALPYPVKISFRLPNVSWTLSVSPCGGWFHKTELALMGVLALFIDLLLILLVYTILQLRQQKKQLKQLSHTDSLTGLFNRRVLRHELTEKCKNSQRAFAFFYMDLNRFKSVNDSLGHSYGDLLLEESARRIQNCLTSRDVLCRVGGDEFAAIVEFEEKDELSARLVAIQAAIALPFELKEHTVHISISIGCAVYPTDGVDATALVKAADEAMYAMKNTARFAAAPGGAQLERERGPA